MRRFSYITAFMIVAISGVLAAQGAKGPEHSLLAPADIKWGAPPPVFEKGAQFAVISGDPGKPGYFVVRLRMPAGYKIAPHWHPTDEHVTVMSGRLSLGMGDKANAAAMKDLPAGGYAMLPADMRHFVTAKVATEVQVSGSGPFVLTYVNAADDPSKRMVKK